MKILAPQAATSRRISDTVAVVGMLTATAIAIFVVTLFFAVLKRFSRQEGSKVPVSVTASVSRPNPPSGVD